MIDPVDEKNYLQFRTKVNYHKRSTSRLIYSPETKDKEQMFDTLDRINLSMSKILGFKDGSDRPEHWTKDIQLLRPEQIDPTAQWVLIRDDVSGLDVVQSELGNCWFTSPLAAFVHIMPELVKQIVSGPFTAQDGTVYYKVQLYSNGKPVIVLVSDQFPCNETGEMLFGQSKRSQLFVQLIEKGYTLSNGSYKHMEVGVPGEAFSCFAGFPTFTMPTNVWDELCVYQGRNCPMVATTAANGDPSEDEFELNGLVNRHTYVLLKFDVAADDTQLVRLYDPTGRDGWNGDFSSDSTAWDRENENDFNAKFERVPGDGSFWMPFIEFGKFFNFIGLSYRIGLNPRFEYRYSAPFMRGPTDEINCTFYQVQVFQSCELNLSLHQESHRKPLTHGLPRLSTALAIFRLGNCAEKICGEFVDFSESSSQVLVTLPKVDLTRGIYVVVVYCFSHWPLGPGINDFDFESLNLKRNEYILVFNLDSKVAIRVLNCKPSLIGDSLYELITSNGLRKHIPPFVDTYRFVNEWSGMLYVVENHSKSQTLGVKVSCDLTNKELNLVSTRGQFTTKDEIPPGCWQIISVIVEADTRHKHFVKKFSVKHGFSPKGAISASHTTKLGIYESIHAPRPITRQIPPIESPEDD